MSPKIPTDDVGMFGFPRVSGDEPNYLTHQSGTPKFSPRERG